jgi:phosphotriesterase-related protein
MSEQDSRFARLSRREVIALLGVGAGFTPLSGLRGDSVIAAAETAAQSAKKVTFPKGAIIRTILKDISPETLAGATLFHEHLSMLLRTRPGAPPREPHFSGDIDLMVSEVQAAGKDGVGCIVDGGAKALGGSVENLRKIAMRTDVHIVVGGGLHTRGNYPPDIATKTAEQIADDFLRDAATDRWGAMGEIGTSSKEMHPDERKVLQAVGLVHQRTGLPIFTHTPHDGCSKCALDQLDIFESQAVNPRSVCIGHLSDITDEPRAETQKAIAKRGAFVGFDTVGHQGQPTPPDSRKVAMILAVIEAGYEDRVLLSSDFWNKSELKANSGAGISVALTEFVPKLRYAGVKETTLHEIMFDNPRRLLAFVPKKNPT